LIWGCRSGKYWSRLGVASEALALFVSTESYITLAAHLKIANERLEEANDNSKMPLATLRSTPEGDSMEYDALGNCLGSMRLEQLSCCETR
jgi:hypothetical protein